MNKREDILLAALELLATKGIHATPMSVIAKKAGTGMGTIYNYFPNKNDLINSIYVKIKQAEEGLFPKVSGEKPIKTQLEEHYSRAVQFYISNPRYFQFIEQLQASPIITQESKEIGYKAVAATIELLEKGKEERIIKNIDTNELMQFIGGTILSYLRWYFLEDLSKRPPLTNQLQMVWDAIKE